jgi:hypothetical protein
MVDTTTLQSHQTEGQKNIIDKYGNIDKMEAIKHYEYFSSMYTFFCAICIGLLVSSL